MHRRHSSHRNKPYFHLPPSRHWLAAMEAVRLRSGRGLLDLFEQEIILAVVRATNGNRTQAADLLGLSLRAIRYKLAQYRDRGEYVPENGSGEPREPLAAAFFEKLKEWVFLGRKLF